MKRNIAICVSALLAGLMIAIGGTAYLMTGYAWLFPIGLLIICHYGLHLFTGKVCYAFHKGMSARWLFIIYALNSISAYICGMVIAVSKPQLVDKARAMVEAKLSEGLALIPLAMLCNVMIFFAVDAFKRESVYARNAVLKALVLIFATTIFVACGFEHCIANAFYFGVAGEFSIKGIIYLLTNGFFNAIGGILVHKLIIFKVEWL